MMEHLKNFCSSRSGRVLAGLALAGALSGCATTSAPGRDPSGGGLLSLREPETLQPEGGDLAEALAHFSRALSHELDQDIPAALAEYGRAIEKDPENGTLYMIASQRLARAGRTEAAFELLESLLERDPENLQALRWLARLHLEAGAPEKALPPLQRAVALRPASEVPYLEAIQLEIQNGNFDEVLRIARLGVEHAESPVRTTRLLVELLLRQSRNARDLVTIRDRREEAETLIRNAIERFPEEEQFLLMSAELRNQAGQYGEALELYRELDRRAENRVEARNRILAHFIRTAGEGPEGVATVREVLESRGEDALSLYLLGVLEESSRLPDQARESFERAAELDPDDLATQRKLALAYFQNDQPARASRRIRQLLDAHPADVELLTLAAHLQLAAENYTEAARHFRKLRLLGSQGEEIERPAQLYAGLAMALLAVEEERGAVDAMRVAAETDPDTLEMIWRHQLRLILTTRDRDPEKAEAGERVLLESLMDLSDQLPDNPDVVRLIGNTHQFRRDYDRALAAFERTETLAREREEPSRWLTPDFYFDLAAMRERTGNIERSEDTFRKLLEVEPDHAPALNYLAYMWAERGENLDQALEYVRKALELDSGNGSYLDTLGWVYFQREKYNAAYRELKKAAEVIPEESVVAEHLGDVLMKLDRPVEAVGYYRIALELGAAERADLVREALIRAEEALSARLNSSATGE